MLCKIADLFVEVPAAGGMDRRCSEYIAKEDRTPDIIIDEGAYMPYRNEGLGYDDMCYMESSRYFYWDLPKFGGLLLHAAAVEFEGRAYLFSGPSTVGKSTHTGLWRQLLGDQVYFLNDDKPALRQIDGKWYVYGTPWCGKNGINMNRRAPLAGICFLRQSDRNSIQQLPLKDALIRVLSQTTKVIRDPGVVAQLMDHVDSLVRQIPIYELENKPDLAAARLSYETMRSGAPE